ncbi:hypothetical protein PHYBLDRAFT_163521 [Phycomyces blakesleeanus NRRL 1555(-)]|uniref:Uncharacterized protein n=1 Tax=Phycomyces blakesleeanus (strain ATCC 8743b / DSM 1359 / FGSC 10004 / NBRC 33097 / NRRL 1555) TaxID=763407 RepID=A0A167PRG1_PHYB8|nr:hypothetical protein PHYBLDRAFT_163521 [Phycomyces blakesleeanus NRRL 1555(-)]OAD78406.1 hypothetical protein PHYBLDRAFT_163521 [Phycomyces blakesleeanus NRRL 1555(-)]|eukprot:XP_018296446.1 hypothetical protein PHYBLDRAFT_163521 [Phycomyces blakesleeanus NRRL 1555(-)]
MANNINDSQDDNSDGSNLINFYVTKNATNKRTFIKITSLKDNTNTYTKLMAHFFQFSRFRTIFLNELYQNQTPPCHSELNEPLDKSREQKFGTKCEFAHQIKCTLLTNLLLSGYRAIGLSGYRDSGLYF